MIERSDIGISTGAYARLPLAEALKRIAALAPSAEIFSSGSHSLLDGKNVRAVAEVGLHSCAPGDLDLHRLGVVLDAGHAAPTGTLEEWLRAARPTIVLQFASPADVLSSLDHLRGRGLLDASLIGKAP